MKFRMGEIIGGEIWEIQIIKRQQQSFTKFIRINLRNFVTIIISPFKNCNISKNFCMSTVIYRSRIIPEEKELSPL